MIMILDYERGEGGGERLSEKGEGEEAEGAWEERVEEQEAMHLCLGVCVSLGLRMPSCVRLLVPHAPYAHTSPRSCPCLPSVRGLRCRLVPRFDNALAPPPSMPCVTPSSYRSISLFAFVHVRLNVLVFDHVLLHGGKHDACP